LAIVLLVLGALVLSQAARLVWVGYLEREWESIQAAKTEADIATAVQEFSSLQRSARRVAVDVGQQPDVLDYLRGGRNDRRALFGAIVRAADAYECGIEVYDTGGELAAWGGSSGPSIDREVHGALDGVMASVVVRTPVASQLLVASPVRSEGKILGVVVVRQTVELDYPLSNRFMSFVGLNDRLGNQLGTTVEFNFTGDTTGRKDGRWLAAPLQGIDDRRVGTVSILRPARSAVIEHLQSDFAVIDTTLMVFLCLAAMFPIVRWLVQRRTRPSGAIGLIAALWSVRYLMVWVGFPGRVLAQSIFDPSLFASEFGGGLARSAGDLFLTVVTFSLSLWFLAPVTEVPQRNEERSSGIAGFLLRASVAIVITFLLFWLLRGLGAVVRSALYDSTLGYGDPGIIVPSFAMSMMILSLGILCAGMLAVGVRVTEHLLASLGTGQPGVIRVIILYGTAAVLFGILQDEPLMSTPYRLMCATLFIGVALFSHARRPVGTRPRSGTTAAFTGVLSLCILVPLFQKNIEDHARSRMEAFAVEFLRPVDGWLKFVVGDGLRQLKEATLSQADARMNSPVALKDVPLGAWAKSTACREGYTALFSILDSAGKEMGRFTIGSQSSLVSPFADALALDSTGMVRIKSIGDGISAVRVYGGTSLLRDPSGRAPGYVRVVIAAGEQQLFRGDNPAVLRRSAGEPLESFYRPITLSEYRDGLLVRTTNPAVPYTHTLSDDIRATLNRPESPTVWSAEKIGDAAYECYSIRRGMNSHDVIVLSMERQPLLLTMVGLVKVPLVFIAAALLGGVVLAVVAWMRGRRYLFTFRDRLLTAMLLTAFVPLVALMFYSQYAVHHRVMETLSRRLEEETASIAQEIAGIGEYADVSSDLTLRPDRVELIASNAGTDFNVYVGNELRISSRPELYATGLLDSRLNGRAYAAVVLDGRRYHMESEHVGLYQYEVGYRPVLDAAGGVIGIVGVPTLYRQDEVDRELSERNAVLIGVYAVVLLAIVIATMILANRIAAPVQKLTALTRDVARGDLEISSRLPRAEGEIGELVQAFGAMARDLRRSRDELVHVERELAWREMARQIAHEIKNPLTPMKLSVQHLRQTYRDRAPDFREILDTVTRTVIEQIDTLSRIASEFSSFARMPRRRIEPCDVEGIVREAVQLFRHDTRVEIHVDAERGLPSLPADRDELRRAFINILRNGVQATPGTGRIDVTVRRSSAGVSIAFRDYGSGIAEDVRPKLFQPNFSTKTDGMGLGLAIVKKTMDDLGASIEIVSAVNSGTTVICEIPIDEDGRLA
jgi:two-component system, NtrC family, nitrogen regulation sensor histidine kinase NtrY